MSDGRVALARARERARYSQDDVGAAMGVSRAMVSYWEGGSRTPNDRQLSALARLYGLEPVDLLEGLEAESKEIDIAGMMLRADSGVDPEAVPGIREFVDFLDRYADLARIVGEPIRGLTQSPFVSRSDFNKKADIRRKAEEVRGHLDLGNGPISDLDAVCEMLGITIYRARLGANLTKVPSGAFVNHPEVGFALLVNLDMTPGRQRFTVAHELAHALFHSDENRCVVSVGGNARESFADTFAGEFLMPGEGVRRFIEEAGMYPRLADPVDVIDIQRYFGVSWPTALVRLRQMNAITAETYSFLKDTVQPVRLAQSLGYPIHPEEYAQDPSRWRIRRFPKAFRRLLRLAVARGLLSPPTAASFAGLALPEMTQMLGQTPTGLEDEPPGLKVEFGELEQTGVI